MFAVHATMKPLSICETGVYGWAIAMRMGDCASLRIICVRRMHCQPSTLLRQGDGPNSHRSHFARCNIVSDYRTEAAQQQPPDTLCFHNKESCTRQKSKMGHFRAEFSSMQAWKAEKMAVQYDPQVMMPCAP